MVCARILWWLRTARHQVDSKRVTPRRQKFQIGSDIIELEEESYKLGSKAILPIALWYLLRFRSKPESFASPKIPDHIQFALAVKWAICCTGEGRYSLSRWKFVLVVNLREADARFIKVLDYNTSAKLEELEDFMRELNILWIWVLKDL
jgi:hypothetical protein